MSTVLYCNTLRLSVYLSVSLFSETSDSIWRKFYTLFMVRCRDLKDMGSITCMMIKKFIIKMRKNHGCVHKLMSILSHSYFWNPFMHVVLHFYPSLTLFWLGFFSVFNAHAHILRDYDRKRCK